MPGLLIINFEGSGFLISKKYKKNEDIMERNYYVYFNRLFDEIKSTIRNNSKSKHNIHATNEDFSEFSPHDIANVYRDINFSALAYINGVFVDRGDSCLGGFAGNAVIAKSILLLVDKEAK